MKRRPTLLLGYTYSLDRIAAVAERAGVQLVLSPKANVEGVPMLSLPSFKDDPTAAAATLNAQIIEYGIDTFWPLTASAFDLSGVTACPVHAVTTPEAYAFVNDKVAFADWLGNDPTRPEGVETVGADATIGEVMRRLNAGEAVCVKPPRGVNGSLYWEIALGADVLGDPDGRLLSPKAYEVALRDREAEEGPERWLVMERLHGPELSIDALCYGGDLLKWMVREKIATATQIVRADHPVIDHVRNIVKALGLHGIVSLQYMYDKHGNLKMLEINLRPSGGCVAYGETALGAANTTGLLYDWLQLLAGMVAPSDIKQWSGEVQIRIKATAYVE